MMNILKQGLLLVTLLTGLWGSVAQAAGWRPTPGLAPQYQRPYRPVLPAPNYALSQRRIRTPSMRRPFPEGTSAGWDYGYPAVRHDPYTYRRYGNLYNPSASASGPGGFRPLGPGSAPRVPAFARQYGWRPAVQPWVAAPAPRVRYQPRQRPADLAQPRLARNHAPPRWRYRPTAGNTEIRKQHHFRPPAPMPSRGNALRSVRWPGSWYATNYPHSRPADHHWPNRQRFSPQPVFYQGWLPAGIPPGYPPIAGNRQPVGFSAPSRHGHREISQQPLQRPSFSEPAASSQDPGFWALDPGLLGSYICDRCSG